MLILFTVRASRILEGDEVLLSLVVSAAIAQAGPAPAICGDDPVLGVAAGGSRPRWTVTLDGSVSYAKAPDPVIAFKDLPAGQHFARLEVVAHPKNRPVACGEVKNGQLYTVPLTSTDTNPRTLVAVRLFGPLSQKAGLGQKRKERIAEALKKLLPTAEKSRPSRSTASSSPP